jgi:hypothetical protein
MVVDEIGVIEIDAPALALRRKAAQKEYAGILRQKGDERMILYPTLAALDIPYVQIALHAAMHFLIHDCKGKKRFR